MTKLRVVATLVVVLATLGVVLVRGLGANLVYYATPTEVLSSDTTGHVRVRLGGQVVPGSIVKQGHGVTSFVVQDATSRVSVVGDVTLPEMFRSGEGVVVEGYLGEDRTFRADTVLVKHGSDYQPPTGGTDGSRQAAG